MRIVVTTEQVVVRRYVVDAPGHCKAREMIEESPLTERSRHCRWQESRDERVTVTEKEEPWPT